MNDRIKAAVREVQDGNRDAFEVIVAEYQGRLRMLTRACLWDPNAADDIAQQALLTAYTRIDTYDSEKGEFYPWIKAIARNTALNANRRHARLRHHQLDYLADLRVETAQALSHGSESRLEAAIERLRSCLRRLPEKVQALFQRHYHDRRPLAEIASETNSSAGAVKVTLFRSRVALKRCMEALGETS